MGGSSLPTASTPGYSTITRNDHTFVGCDCVIAFVEAGEQLGLALGLIHECVDIVQLTGDADASSGTHSLGAAFDVRQYGPEWSHKVWRPMGSAFWPRTGADWAGNEHGHGGISCPHDARIAYQIEAYWRGYSGLGQAKTGTYAGMWGYGSKDPDPWRPSTRRTWREGIAWAEAQTAAIIAQEDPLAGITLKDISNTVWNDTVWVGADGKGYSAGSWVRAGNEKAGRAESLARQALARVAALEAVVRTIAANPSATPEQIEAAAKAGAAAALEERITDADVTLNVSPPTA